MEAAGTCRNKGLEALDELARDVDSIFNRTEEARRTAPFGNRVDAAPTTDPMLARSPGRRARPPTAPTRRRSSGRSRRSPPRRDMADRIVSHE